jgi:hypothetical protein
MSVIMPLVAVLLVSGFELAFTVSLIVTAPHAAWRRHVHAAL